MTILEWIAVLALGGAGAVLRFVIDSAIMTRLDATFRSARWPSTSVGPPLWDSSPESDSPAPR